MHITNYFFNEKFYKTILLAHIRECMNTLSKKITRENFIYSLLTNTHIASMYKLFLINKNY